MSPLFVLKLLEKLGSVLDISRSYINVDNSFLIVVIFSCREETDSKLSKVAVDYESAHNSRKIAVCRNVKRVGRINSFPEIVPCIHLCA